MKESILGAVTGIAQSFLNNRLAGDRTEKDRKENYKFGEMAAENADTRTRALYNDFYSPEALKRQYLEAGLSPSLMFGGSPGQGGMSGAQGSGTTGPQTPFMPLEMVNAALGAAQIENIKAQTKKTNAETRNIKQDTILKQTQEMWQTYLNENKSVEVGLTNTVLQDTEGNTISMYELASNCYDYDQFIKKVREYAKVTNNFELEMNIGRESGQKVLRQIYMDGNRFERDIKVLSEEGVSAQFQQKIVECLNQEGFAEMNAEVALKQMKAAGEAADLTKEQKESWNNIIERLRKTNSTVADIIIVASMILNQGLSHWNVKIGKN